MQKKDKKGKVENEKDIALKVKRNHRKIFQVLKEHSGH